MPWFLPCPGTWEKVQEEKSGVFRELKLGALLGWGCVHWSGHGAGLRPHPAVTILIFILSRDLGETIWAQEEKSHAFSELKLGVAHCKERVWGVFPHHPSLCQRWLCINHFIPGNSVSWLEREQERKHLYNVYSPCCKALRRHLNCGYFNANNGSCR